MNTTEKIIKLLMDKPEEQHSCDVFLSSSLADDNESIESVIQAVGTPEALITLLENTILNDEVIKNAMLTVFTFWFAQDGKNFIRFKKEVEEVRRQLLAEMQ